MELSSADRKLPSKRRDPNTERDHLPQGCERVLLAEDDPLLRKSLQLLLRDLGYRVTACANGAEALEAAAHDDSPIELLFTDFEMPGMTGCELAERLQTDRPGIKVLLTSGWPEDAIAGRLGKPTPLPLIAKPFTPHALAFKLREVLDRR